MTSLAVERPDNPVDVATVGDKPTAEVSTRYSR